MTVLVDIPGVGVVEARNAATEATLRSILKTMQGIQKNTGGSGRGGGGGGGGGAAEGAAGAGKMGNAAFAAGVAIGKFATAVKSTAATIDRLGTSMINTVDSLANMGDSVTGAAGALGGLVSKIPVVGGMMAAAFTAVASAVEHTSKSFQAATASGATFGGSVQRFGAAASAAGMTMDQFGQLIGKNGEAMMLLGGTTEDGAKRFADISRNLRTSSKELYNLGYNTQDVNEGLAAYTKLTKLTGGASQMTNAQLVSGTKQYLKELDLLAKVTGESRKEIEARQAKIAADARVQAAVGALDPKVAKAFNDTISVLPKSVDGVTTDLMTTLVGMTPDAQAFQSMMSNTAEVMKELGAKAQAGGELTDADRERLRNTLIAEAKAKENEINNIAKYNQEFGFLQQVVTDAKNLEKNGIARARQNQTDTQNTTDGVNANLVSMQQQLAEMSNSFQLFLAGQGKLLGSMMELLGQFAGFVQKYLLPIIQDYLVPALKAVAKFIVNYVIPAFEWMIKTVISLAKQVYEFLTPIFGYLADQIKKHVIPALLEIVLFVERNWKPILAAFATFIAVSVVPPLIAFVGALASSLLAFLPFVAVGAAVVAAFILIDKIMDRYGIKVNMLTDAFSWLKLRMEDWWMWMKEGVYKFLNIIPGMRGDYDEKLKEIKQEREGNKEEREKIEKKLTADALKNKADAEARDKEIDKLENKRREDLKNGNYGKAFGLPSIEEIKRMGGPNFGVPAYTAPGGGGAAGGGGGPEDSRTGEDYKGVSGSMSPDTLARMQYGRLTGATHEETRRAIERQAEEKKAAKEKADKEAEEKKKAEEKAKEEEKKKGSPQKSAEVLLAELNTKLDANNQLMKDLVRLNDGQLVAVEGLGNDAFRYPRS